VFNFQTVSPHYSEAINHVRSSVQDKTKTLDQTFIEVAIFGLFKIDVLNLIKVKVSLAKEFHIQPSEIEMMPAWEYELFMKELNNAVKEDNKRNEQEMNNSGYKDVQKMANIKNIERMQRNMGKPMSMNKLPNGMSIPRLPKN
jgi:hypothetical protein